MPSGGTGLRSPTSSPQTLATAGWTLETLTPRQTAIAAMGSISRLLPRQPRLEVDWQSSLNRFFQVATETGKGFRQVLRGSTDAPGGSGRANLSRSPRRQAEINRGLPYHGCYPFRRCLTGQRF